MRVAIMSREYPPEVYGGAGVHVTELVRHLRALCAVDVHCMGAPRDTAVVAQPDPALAAANSALQVLSAELRMTHDAAGADLAHSHTWYTGLAGHLASLLYRIPHVVTAHSLEPSRPWKEEQLGGGYRISSWSERNAFEHADAVIAVSAAMRRDVIAAYPSVDPDRVHLVHNGIDTDIWHPGPPEGDSVLAELGVDPDRPIVAFVGRITRQKGVGHLIAAAHEFDPELQLLLCAGAPDTPEIEAETTAAVERLTAARTGVIWVRDMLPIPKIREILSAASVFVCPSVYEPLGIVNLEAMATETAVVASDVGGIPEVVEDGVTGRLVHYDPADTRSFVHDLAAAVNETAGDKALAEQFGKAGRRRANAEFSWPRIAEQTLTIYEDAVLRRGR